jgi:DNA-binding GntR family transcriptional regulator
VRLEKLDIDRSTTVDRVVIGLRQAMFDGAIAPGEQLREIQLSHVLGVARSTVREALQALATDGLVTRMPNRGAMVRQLTIADVDDIFKARLVLESAGAQATQICSGEALQQLEQTMHVYAEAASTDDPGSASNAHVAFHCAIVGLTGSQRLVEAQRSLMRELQLAIATIDRTSDDLPRQVREHRALYELLTYRRADEAVRFLEADQAHAKAYVSRRAISPPAPTS